jgi:hypothetical protein
MFEELKNLYKDKCAILLLGGPSLIKNLDKLNELKSDYIILADCCVLTPLFIKSKVKVDFILCPFPEKLAQNSLQNFIFRSFLSNIDIKNYLKTPFHNEVDYLANNFNNIYESWSPEKGIHKKFRIKKNIFLNKSPLSLLNYYGNTKIIIDINKFNELYQNINLPNKFYGINFFDDVTNFNYKNYFNPIIANNNLQIPNSTFLNSAAISFLPIIKTLGFKELFIIGMDMNMLGSMEFSYNYIFKSFFHYSIFFLRARKSFNANFKLNFPYYLRPKSEFSDFEKIFSYNELHTFNIVQNNFLRGKIKNLREISFQEFFDNNKKPINKGD